MPGVPHVTRRVGQGGSEMDSAPGAEWPGLLEAELLGCPCPDLTCKARCLPPAAQNRHVPPWCRARLILLVLFPLQTFDANDLYQGQNFNKVLSSLVTLNKVTAGKCLSTELERRGAGVETLPFCHRQGERYRA